MEAQSVAMLPHLTEAMLSDWVARSIWLSERLHDGSPASTVHRSESAGALASSWRRLAAKDDDGHFHAYLARLGLAESEAVTRLAAGPAGSAMLPDWARRLPQLVELVCGVKDRSSEDRYSPFSDLFASLGGAVWDGIAAGSDIERPVWAATVRENASAGLARHLSSLFADSLYVWFDAFRSVRQTEGEGLLAAQAGERANAHAHAHASPSQLYDDFVSWLREGHFVRLLDGKPVLARLFAQSVLQWERHIGELAGRLEHDRPALVSRFFGGHDPGAVVELEFGISDRHRDGRGVVIVRFEHGQRLVYKPRDLKIDAAWVRFLDVMHEAGAPGQLRTPDVLCRPGYGWAAFVEARPCTTPEEVRLFFERAGALLTLFQILGSSDFHQENVIACGAWPVPIDLETLLRPAVAIENRDTAGHPALAAAAERVRASVFESGYLPYWNTFRSKRWIGGGLGWSAPEPVTVTGWLHVNTNVMTLGPKPLPAEAMLHLPRLGDGVVDPSGFIDAIDAGLVDMGRFVLKHRDVVRRALDAFRDTSVRVVLRDTRFYEMLGRRAVQPARLSNGVHASMELEFLLRFHHPVSKPALSWVRLEQTAMLRLDTPLWRMRADATTLREAGNDEIEIPYPEAPALSPLAHALSRLDAFSVDHLEQQRRSMRFAFSRNGGAAVFDGGKAWPTDPGWTWRAEDMVRRAEHIGEHLVSLAVTSGDGAAWLGLPTAAIDAEPRIQVLGPGFYDGTSGIGLFLLALARATGRDDFRQAGLRVFATLRHRVLARSPSDLADGERMLGAGEGLALCLYPLVLGAQLADCAQLIDCAEAIAHGISDERIAADTAYDVIGGAAGTIFGLLALHDAGRPIGLDRALACGRHLLAHCRPPRDVAQAGAGGTRALAGMSHGAAGFACALQRLAVVSGRGEFAACASDWLAYEHALYDEAAGNWPDLRFDGADKPEPDHTICRWCHGATGIGLARLVAHRCQSDAHAVAEDVERAIARTIDEPMSALDSLCCGNFGRIDFLLEAGVRLERPALVDMARQRAGARMAQTAQGFSWPFGTDCENLGFFQGLAGIGYVLLRLADPRTFACALLWEARAGGAPRDEFAIGNEDQRHA